MTAQTTRAGWKRRVFEVLEVPPLGDPVALFVERAIVVLIMVNVASVVLETVPSLRHRYGGVFLAIEVGTVFLFALEYVLRVWVSDEHLPLKRHGRIGARLRYVTSPSSLVDLMAVAPSLIGFGFGVYDVNVFAVFRLLRFLKLARYSAGMSSLINAVASERRALAASAVIMAGLIVTSASLMHAIEGDIQPDRFGSIPLAMYWAVTTLTTVGYGDIVPVTGAGRVLAGVVMLFGFCMFALPVGIIATAFAREIHSRDFVVTWGMVARVPLFSQLSAAEIADVMRLLRAQTVEAGTTITAAGEPAHSMYFISSGTVEIDLPHEKMRLSDGAFFGEIAVLRRARRSADVVALTHTRLLLLDAEDLQYLMQKKSEIATHIRSVARERIAHEAVTPRGDIALEEVDDMRASPDDWL
ncbi:cyclic nucleotide-gated ion channel [Pinisolibacter aquiterrae]|uniref:cyclic nucleotide-gated ion channel n=1 Tax=Pinisolibacter aquiterrae TaxID=2815579 RepID=UPI001C3D0B0C|nr:cyclic nucleotide-gated ion channel [Pinisolibacter aquiterrae]MBV5266414.1 ion transporter [Pinisolibacter aquiterrae]MCC8236176.1 cyclic nucleotide-gated ion channel/potassium channel family protein [Pinisolibacter aquiterrae]